MNQLNNDKSFILIMKVCNSYLLYHENGLIKIKIVYLSFYLFL